MKKLFALPLAVLFVAACSESTAPESAADLSPSFAKPTAPPTTVTGTHANATWNFNTGIASSGTGAVPGFQMYTESSEIAVADGPQTIHPPSYPSGNNVLGAPKQGGGIETLNDERVEIFIPAGARNYSIDLQLFLIGSWDGRGQQAQHGAFGIDDWRIAARCSNGTLVSIFHTTFSNQKTVQQNYPKQITQGGGSPYLTGSEGRDALGFNTHVPSFESAADSRYDLSYSGANPCGNGAAFTIVLNVPDFDLQHDFDESWTMDNIVVKTDS